MWATPRWLTFFEFLFLSCAPYFCPSVACDPRHRGLVECCVSNAMRLSLCNQWTPGTEGWNWTGHLERRSWNQAKEVTLSDPKMCCKKGDRVSIKPLFISNAGQLPKWTVPISAQKWRVKRQKFSQSSKSWTTANSIHALRVNASTTWGIYGIIAIFLIQQ